MHAGYFAKMQLAVVLAGDLTSIQRHVLKSHQFSSTIKSSLTSVRLSNSQTPENLKILESSRIQPTMHTQTRALLPHPSPIKHQQQESHTFSGLALFRPIALPQSLYVIGFFETPNLDVGLTYTRIQDTDPSLPKNIVPIACLQTYSRAHALRSYTDARAS